MMNKIIHLGKYYFPIFGGIETATQNLAEAGVKLGFSVTCFTAGNKRCFPRKYELNGVEVHRAATFGHVLSTPLAPGMLQFRRYKKLVLHVHLPNPIAEISAFFHLFLNRGRCELIPFFHAMPFRGQGIGKWWFRFVTRPLLRRANTILVSSRYVINAFPAMEEFRSKITVAPFVTKVASEAQVTQWWSKKQKVVLALGRLVPYKGFLELLDAWKDHDQSGYQLVIIGEGPLLGRLNEKIRELGLNSVAILPRCSEEEKLRWFQRAKIFVLPSVNESETFGIAAQEAMAHGLPVITTDVNTGLQELAQKGNCGAIASRGDSRSLAKALEKLLRYDDFTLERVGQKNRAFVEQNFSPESLLNLYQDLLVSSCSTKRAA